MGEWGRMRVGGGIIWVSGGGCTFFMGECGWVKVYFGWMGVGGHSL